MPAQLFSGFLVVSRREYAYNAFQRARELAGIDPYTFHQSRHTYVSWSAMAGSDLYALAKNMGISSLTVLKRYAHLSHTFRTSVNTALFPAIAATRLYRRVRGDDHHDLRRPGPAPNRLLEWFFALERHVVPTPALPFGTSLLVGARRP